MVNSVALDIVAVIQIAIKKYSTHFTHINLLHKKIEYLLHPRTCKNHGNRQAESGGQVFHRGTLTVMSGKASLGQQRPNKRQIAANKRILTRRGCDG